MPYNSANNTFTDAGTDGDGIMQITWTGIWEKGTIIRAVETGATTDLFTMSSSPNGPTLPNIVINNPKFSIGGNEGVSVFTSNTLTNPNLNIVEIYGFLKAAGSDPNPNDDPDCPCSSDFVAIDFNSSSIDACNFMTSVRTGAVSLVDYNTVGNYTTSGSNLNLDLTEFSNLTFGGSATYLCMC